MLGWIARSIHNTEFGREAVRDRADLSAFRDKPTVRLVLGLVILALSFVLGWPLVAAFGVAAIWFGNPYLALIGGPAAYAFSWGLWGIAMLLTGYESYKYGRIFARWATRRFIEKYGM